VTVALHAVEDRVHLLVGEGVVPPPLRVEIGAVVGDLGQGVVDLVIVAGNAVVGEVLQRDPRALAERQIDSTDPRVRAAAACALGRRDTLRAALAAEETADVRPLLLEALGRAGGGPEIAAAIDSGRADSPRLFLAALRAAGRARAKELAPRLRELVEDADVVVAAHAAHALVLLGERAATLPLLARAPWLVVSAVARGCGETGDESLVPALVAAYEADDGAWAGSFPGPDGEYDLPRREIPLAVRRLGGKQAEAFLRKIGA